ncbi:nuclear transport factor 2 family protein [Massilia sp. W12]|uniref:nuclear transport factor 2 family protein n=1 Tax=Massilia sp. W12 TaxID=3126507 RepID=UPI0030CC285B
MHIFSRYFPLPSRLAGALLLSAATLCPAAETPQALLQQLWALSSHGPNQAVNLSALGELFHEDAVVFGGGYRGDAPRVSRSSKAEFLKQMAPLSAKGFYECEIERQVLLHERFATVYSVVETRSTLTQAKPDFVGANSLQLFKTEQGWKILSLYYFVGKREAPVTSKGESGVCLR